MITKRTWPWIENEKFLLVFAMRGHRLPPELAGLSRERLLIEAALRGRLGPNKRWCGDGLAAIALGSLRSGCEKRGGRLIDAQVCSSCIFAHVEVPPFSQYGLCDAVRLVTARRARRSLGWSRSERVFSKRVRMSKEENVDLLNEYRASLPELPSL